MQTRNHVKDVVGPDAIYLVYVILLGEKTESDISLGVGKGRGRKGQYIQLKARPGMWSLVSRNKVPSRRWWGSHKLNGSSGDRPYLDVQISRESVSLKCGTAADRVPNRRVKCTRFQIPL